MDIGRILARSVEIGWRYKVLWLLGFIFALFGGGGGFSSPSTFNYQVNSNELPFGRGAPLPPDFQQTITAIVGLAACFALIWFLLTLYFRFVARGALVAAVRSIEKGGAPTLGSAWREGQHYWGRLLGLGLLVGLPVAVFSFALIVVAFLPFLGAIVSVIQQAMAGVEPSQDEINRLISSVFGSIFLICCAVLCIAVVQLIIHPIYQFAVRAIVLEEAGVTRGVGLGWQRVRENLGSVALIYLALIGIRILWGIVIYVLAVVVALVIAAVVAAAIQQSLTAAVVLALAFAIPLAIVFAILEGLFQVFEQNVWTESYMAALPPPAAASAVPPLPPVSQAPTSATSEG